MNTSTTTVGATAEMLLKNGAQLRDVYAFAARRFVKTPDTSSVESADREQKETVRAGRK